MDIWLEVVASVKGQRYPITYHDGSDRAARDPARAAKADREKGRLNVVTFVGRSMRRPVVVIGPLAFKFARNAKGRASNLYEAKLYRTSSEARRALLCPIVWVSPGGRLLIMRLATPLVEMMTIDEYLEVSEIWDARPGEDSYPFEPKECDWGWCKGRRVALDYSTPAWEDA